MYRGILTGRKRRGRGKRRVRPAPGLAVGYGHVIYGAVGVRVTMRSDGRPLKRRSVGRTASARVVDGRGSQMIGHHAGRSDRMVRRGRPRRTGGRVRGSGRRVRREPLGESRQSATAVVGLRLVATGRRRRVSSSGTIFRDD